jgi:CRP-like cAMP-binding protein
MRPGPYLLEKILGAVPVLRFDGSHSNSLRDSSAPNFASRSVDRSELETCSSTYTPDGPAPAPDHAKSHNPFVRKLSSLVGLSGEDCEALECISRNARQLDAGHVLIHEESPPDYLHLVMKGTAFRYKMLPSGRRQILGYLLPGDLCDGLFLLNRRPDHSLALLTPAQVVKIPLHQLTHLVHTHPRIERALMLMALMDRAILREWLLNVGQRNALERLSHFFCEMHLRAQLVGLVDPDGSFEFPINQYALADTLGLTPVHVNRTLQRLRAQQLILLCRRRLTILNHDRVSSQAGFSAQYLRALA